MRDLKTLGRHYAAVLQKTAPLLHRVHPGVLKKKRATGSTSNIRSCRSETEDEDKTRPCLCFFIFSTSSVMSHFNDDGLLVFSLFSVRCGLVRLFARGIEEQQPQQCVLDDPGPLSAPDPGQQHVD